MMIKHISYKAKSVAFALCSVTLASQAYAISGGADAAHGEFPYFAAIGEANKPIGVGWALCGATLIAPQWILTAKHCAPTAPLKPENFKIMFGLTHVKNPDLSKAYFAHIKSIHPYSQADDPDLALIRLTADVPAQYEPVSYN